MREELEITRRRTTTRELADAEPKRDIWQEVLDGVREIRAGRGKAVQPDSDAAHSHLSTRDSIRVVTALKHPPKPNAKLLAAAKSLPKRQG